jgi:antitoxin component of RelBE/YafQ-DinJ toxin-antitoxin module
MTTKKPRLTAYIDEDLLTKFTDYCKAEAKSQSAVISLLIEQFLEEETMKASTTNTLNTNEELIKVIFELKTQVEQLSLRVQEIEKKLNNK